MGKMSTFEEIKSFFSGEGMGAFFLSLGISKSIFVLNERKTQRCDWSVEFTRRCLSEGIFVIMF